VPAFFDLPSFLRSVSMPLIARFFSQHPGFADLDWTGTNPDWPSTVLQRLSASAPAQRRKILEALRRVESLASSLGTQVLIESGRHVYGLAGKLASMNNGRDRALWVQLSHPEVIDNARTIARLESTSKQMWESHHGLPRKSIQVTDATISELRRQIMIVFQTEQYRGDRCALAHVRRDGGIDRFIAYLSDFPDEHTFIGSGGRLARAAFRPTFRISLTYRPAEGTLDICAPGGTRIRKRLAHTFACVALGVDHDLRLPDAGAFDLDLLKARNLTFPTKPADGISLVRIQALKLVFPGRIETAVEVSIDGRRKDGSIHDALDEKLRESSSRLASARVVSAVLQALVRTSEGRERKIRFRLSAPSLCDLGDAPEELLLRGYLRDWGIERDENCLASAA